MDHTLAATDLPARHTRRLPDRATRTGLDGCFVPATRRRRWPAGDHCRHHRSRPRTRIPPTTGDMPGRS